MKCPEMKCLPRDEVLLDYCEIVVPFSVYRGMAARSVILSKATAWSRLPAESFSASR